MPRPFIRHGTVSKYREFSGVYRADCGSAGGVREGRFSEGGRTSYLEKENIKLEACGLPEWDRSDPVHAGLQNALKWSVPL